MHLCIPNSVIARIEGVVGDFDLGDHIHKLAATSHLDKEILRIDTHLASNFCTIQQPEEPASNL